MTFIDAGAPIAAHEALTTNVHGTGAGNVVVGDDEIAGFIAVGSGDYAGNDSQNRAIAYSMSTTPSFVIITGGGKQWVHHKNIQSVLYSSDTKTYSVTAMDATNFYVGNAVGYTHSANANGTTYYWKAFA